MKWLWILTLAGCAGDEGGGGGGKDAPVGGDDTAAAATPTLAFPAGRVIDPKLDGAALSVEASGCDATVVLTGASQTRTLASATWDGRDDAGVPFDPGPVTVTARCDGVATAELHVVRLAPVEIDFVAGASGDIVPLAYHKLSVARRGVTPLEGAEYRAAPADALAAADDDAGAPRPAVPPWTDAAVPPWGAGDADATAFNVPAAYAAGAAPRIEVRTADRAVSARSGAPVDAFGIGAPEVRVSVAGTTANWRPDTTLTLDLPAVEGTLGRETRTLAWTWEARDGDTWVPIPGTFETTHTLWRTAGPAQLRDGEELGFAPAIAWIGVLAELEGPLTGVAPEPGPVLDAIRDHVNEGDWIIYDPNDASYSSYEGRYIYWEYAWSEVGEWLDRDDGIRLYCHSLSCLFSVLAGHVGVYAPQQVLGVNFRTNLTRAAGTTDWLAWSFNSHSVVSPDDGLTIWDASISLDGDGDPGSAPVTEVAPKGLTFEEYTSLLTDDPIDIVNAGLCYFE